MIRKADKRIHSADIIVPITRRPIANASVMTVKGIITALGSRSDIVAEFPNVEEKRWEGVLLPGLVNAHSHLQYTGFSELGLRTHSGFEEWSEDFDTLYAERSPKENWSEWALRGAQMAIKNGVSTIADICTDIEAASCLKEAGLSGYVFLEVMGRTWSDWSKWGRRDFIALFESMVDDSKGSVKIGISPHAPYSLDTAVFKDLSRLGKDWGVLLHTHLAESDHEDSYYRHGVGPLADFIAEYWSEYQIFQQGGTGMSSVEYAASTGLFEADCYIAHGIYIDEKGRELLRQKNVAVALCPRSNLTIGLDPPPVAAYLKEGNPICIGTDSLSSSPSLDLMEDLRLLREVSIKQGYEEPDLCRCLLEAATMGGANTLGMAQRKGGIGSITPNKRADFSIFAIDTDLKHVEENLILYGPGHCVGTVIAGETAFEA